MEGKGWRKEQRSRGGEKNERLIRSGFGNIKTGQMKGEGTIRKSKTEKGWRIGGETGGEKCFNLF